MLVFYEHMFGCRSALKKTRLLHARTYKNGLKYKAQFHYDFNKKKMKKKYEPLLNEH